MFTQFLNDVAAWVGVNVLIYKEREVRARVIEVRRGAKCCLFYLVFEGLIVEERNRLIHTTTTGNDSVS